MDVKELRALHEAYTQVYEPQELTEEVEIATEYFYEMGFNEDGVNILIEELGDEEFAEWVYDISEEYTLTEARAGGARVEPVTKSGKAIGSLKGGAKTSAIRSRQKEKAARREAEAKSSAAKPSGMTAALRSQAAQSAATKQKPKASTPTQTKKGIGGLIGAAVQRAKQDTELLRKSWQTARAAGRPAERRVAQAAGTAAGAVHGAAKAVHRAGQQFGKSEAGQKIKAGLGKTAKAAAGAAGAGVGSLVAGKSPAAAAGRAAGTFVRKLTREDIYDIVLSHLLDEGYAETVDAAEKIMVNMSEEWRDDIIDEAVEIISVTSPEGKRRSGSRIYSGKASQMQQNARKLSDLQKRQRSNPKAIGTRSARRQADQEIENNAKKSIKNLNVDPNSEVKHGPDNVDREGYREIPTDYRARRRRASGR